MRQIEIETPTHTSRLWVKRGLFREVHKLVKRDYPKSRVALVTDAGLWKIYGAFLKKALPKALMMVIPQGEVSKSMTTMLDLASQMLRHGMGRDDVLIAFGGGVVTDLGGFLAAVYMRGIPFITIPSSLLCMVDAGIGGKNGVDFEAKNSLGTTYLPHYVLIDADLLKGLPERALNSSLAEVIKYAVTLDTSIIGDLDRKTLPLDTLIEKSVSCKAAIIEKDLHEKHERKVLNFGHTFGHAIEAASDFKYTHGEAISIGMMLANRVAHALKRQKNGVAETTERLLKKFNLPTELPAGMTLKSLLPYLLKDKKRRGEFIDYVIVPELGKVTVTPIKPKDLIRLAA